MLFNNNLQGSRALPHDSAGEYHLKPIYMKIVKQEQLLLCCCVSLLYNEPV